MYGDDMGEGPRLGGPPSDTGIPEGLKMNVVRSSQDFADDFERVLALAALFEDLDQVVVR
jgi:hypothetical protein